MGKVGEVIGQNEATQTIIDRFVVHDKPEEIEKMMGGINRIADFLALS